MKHLPIVAVESRCEMNHVPGLTFMCDTFIGTVYGKGGKQDKKWNVIIFRETVAYTYYNIRCVLRTVRTILHKFS